MQEQDVQMHVNGKPVSGKVEARTHLGDFLRQAVGLTGTHLGCEHGVCGACTVIVDGDAVRSCLMLAVQADNCNEEIREAISGNICRCTGYQGIISAAKEAAAKMAKDNRN